VDVDSIAGYEEALRYQNDPAAGDRALAVRFYTEEFQDEAESAKQGRPIFKTWECCEIRAPGSRDVKMGRIKYMKPDPRVRFARAYSEWRAKGTIRVDGQPLRAWGLITPARAKEYEALGVHTVEQLAALADTHAQGIMGSVGDRTKAQDFLAMAQGQQPLAAARAELEKARSEIDTLKDIVRQQGEKIEALVDRQNGITPAPKRRGRPPKVQATDTEN